MRCLLQLREGAEDVEKNGAVQGSVSSSCSVFCSVLGPPMSLSEILLNSSDHVSLCFILQLNPTRTEDIIHCISCHR